MTDLYPDLRRPPEPMPVPARALAIGAHPDDAEFGAGGTLAAWGRAGAAITILIVTDGSKGTWDPDVDPAALAAERRREAEAAAATLGNATAAFLDHPDGELVYTPELRKELCHWIRTIRPDVVLTHDPWQRYQLHPDHRATGFAVVDAVVSARDPHFCPGDGLAAHRPRALLLWSADVPDHWEDVAATIDTKIAALLCHRSQGTTTMGGADLNEERRTEFSDRIRAWAATAGSGPGIAAAEAFKRITP